MLQQGASIFKDRARDSDGMPYTDLGLPVADWTETARGNHYTNDGDTIGRAGDV
jgi:hypothetical protein